MTADYDEALVEKAARALCERRCIHSENYKPQRFCRANDGLARTVLDAVGRDIYQQALTDALHPEFGWAWRDDEVIGQAVQQAREEGRREVAGAITFDTTCLNCARVIEKSASAYFDGEKAGMADGARQVLAAVEELGDGWNNPTYLTAFHAARKVVAKLEEGQS